MFRNRRFLVLALRIAPPDARAENFSGKRLQRGCAYIFRKGERLEVFALSQGGGGLLLQKRGGKSFPLDPFALKISGLFCGVLEKFKLFLKSPV